MMPINPVNGTFPAGRLDLGENPFDGLKREALEEANLDIEIKIPIDIHHFTRDDGQKITMIIFLCKPLSVDLKLSKEHTDFEWTNPDSASQFPEWLNRTVDNFSKYIKQ